MSAKGFLAGAVLAIFAASAMAAAAAPAPLVDAVKSKDRAAALKLIAQRADVNATEPDGTTALHWAVHQDDLDLAERLIKAGAKVNLANDYGSTPMSEAANVGNAAMIDMLLKAGADANHEYAIGYDHPNIKRTVLILAAQMGDPTIVQMLLSAGANVDAKGLLHGSEHGLEYGTALEAAKNADVINLLQSHKKTQK